MIKKLFLFLNIIFGAVFATQAQKALNEVVDLLKGDQKNYSKAKTSIDALCAGNEFKGSAKAWFLKGVVYQTLMADEKSAGSTPGGNQIALEAYKKVFQIDPKFKTDAEFSNNLLNLMVGFYNDGINMYNAKKWKEAFDAFDNISSVNTLEASKNLSANKFVDTITAQAKMYQGNCAYEDNKLDQALPLLEAAAANPITTNENTYYMLINIYRDKQNLEKWLPTIEKAKKLNPDNKIVIDEELNYYIFNNKQNELAAMLEKLVQKEPNNAEYHFNLGTTYERIAKPQDKSGADLTRPADYNELIAKAEQAYKKAISLNDKNGGYQYNLGALYYNQAVEINNQMSEKGIDKPKFEGFKKQRNDLFNKSIPYMEKALQIFEASVSKEENKLLHKQCLTGLKNMSNLMENKPKLDMYTQKLSQFKS